MHWIDKEFPNTVYIVEVKYSGDVAISTCRVGDMPKDKDNQKGFTKGFWSYDDAKKYARHVAEELQIKCLV